MQLQGEISKVGETVLQIKGSSNVANKLWQDIQYVPADDWDKDVLAVNVVGWDDEVGNVDSWDEFVNSELVWSAQRVSCCTFFSFSKFALSKKSYM